MHTEAELKDIEQRLQRILEIIGELDVTDNDGELCVATDKGFIPLNNVDIKTHLCFDDVQQLEFYFEIHRQLGLIVPDEMRRKSVTIGNILAYITDPACL